MPTSLLHEQVGTPKEQAPEAAHPSGDSGHLATRKVRISLPPLGSVKRFRRQRRTRDDGPTITRLPDAFTIHAVVQLAAATVLL